MPNLIVELTQDQYDRYQQAMQKLFGMDTSATDDQLIAQLKREASAITYAAEIGNGNGDSWKF